MNMLAQKLIPALEEITVDAVTLRATVRDRHIEAATARDLIHQVTKAIYEAFHQNARAHDVAMPRYRDPRLEQSLTMAVPHQSVTTTARTLQDEGEPLVTLSGIRVRVPAAAIRGSQNGTVTVDLPAVRPALSPGFLFVEGSGGAGVQRGPVLRCYVHLTDAGSAPDVWRQVLVALEGSGACYRAKALTIPEGYPRHDALVIYVGEQGWHALDAVIDAVAGMPGVGQSTSPFTKQVRPGVALAWEPIRTRATDRKRSFGEHRSAAFAEGLVRHATGRTAGMTLTEAIADALAEVQCDPAAPERNLASPQDFPLRTRAAGESRTHQ